MNVRDTAVARLRASAAIHPNWWGNPHAREIADWLEARTAPDAEAIATALVGSAVGQCGNASPGNGRYHPCGISNFCELPAGHAGWHQEDQARWGKHWSDADADGRAADAVKGTLRTAADKLDRQAEAHNESIHDYTDLLRVWADDDTRWGQGR